MTFKELQALILGYRGSDAATRERILKLVPDLAELVADEALLSGPVVRRWLVTIADASAPDVTRGKTTVICAEEHLPIHERDFADNYPYIKDPVVRHQDVT